MVVFYTMHAFHSCTTFIPSRHMKQSIQKRMDFNKIELDMVEILSYSDKSRKWIINKR